MHIDVHPYLRNLPDESRRLREALKSAEQFELCEVEVRTDSTAGDIFKVFQDRRYRNRIAIFHYGGHANGYQLLLDSPEGKAAAADAGGRAAFLAQQQGLHDIAIAYCCNPPGRRPGAIAVLDHECQAPEDGEQPETIVFLGDSLAAWLARWVAFDFREQGYVSGNVELTAALLAAFRADHERLNPGIFANRDER